MLPMNFSRGGVVASVIDAPAALVTLTVHSPGAVSPTFSKVTFQTCLVPLES